MPTFAELEELAKAPSEENRRMLLNHLTDMFLDGDEPQSSGNAAMYSDIVLHVLDSVAEEARRAYADRIAAVETMPRDVITKLSWDSIEVAAPVLEQSPVLTDDDLRALAAERADPFLLAISRRASVSERVTDILLDRGSDAVVTSVAGNLGASISTSGYETLASKAESDTALQAAIVDRDDLTIEFGSKIEPFLSAQLKKRLSKKLKLDENEVSGLVEKAKSKMEEMLAGRKNDQADAKKLIKKVRDGKVTLNKAAEQLATETRPKPLASLISAMSDVPESMVSNVLLKVNGMPLAITCKALDLSEDAFATIAKMRCEVLRIPASSGDRLVIQYRDLDIADAGRTMDFLKSRSEDEAESAA